MCCLKPRIPYQDPSGPCSENNGGCEQFCFALPSEGGLTKECGCADGYRLREDALTCQGNLTTRPHNLPNPCQGNNSITQLAKQCEHYNILIIDKLVPRDSLPTIKLKLNNLTSTIYNIYPNHTHHKLKLNNLSITNILILQVPRCSMSVWEAWSSPCTPSLPLWGKGLLL